MLAQARHAIKFVSRSPWGDQEMAAGLAPREIRRWRLGRWIGRWAPACAAGRARCMAASMHGRWHAWPVAAGCWDRWSRWTPRLGVGAWPQDRWTPRLGVGVRGAWPLVAAGGEDERRPTPWESRRESETGGRLGKRLNLIKWRPTLDRAVSVPGQHEHGPQQRVGPGSTTG